MSAVVEAPACLAINSQTPVVNFRLHGAPPVRSASSLKIIRLKDRSVAPLRCVPQSGVSTPMTMYFSLTWSPAHLNLTQNSYAICDDMYSSCAGSSNRPTVCRCMTQAPVQCSLQPSTSTRILQTKTRHSMAGWAQTGRHTNHLVSAITALWRDGKQGQTIVHESQRPTTVRLVSGNTRPGQPAKSPPPPVSRRSSPACLRTNVMQRQRRKSSKELKDSQLYSRKPSAIHASGIPTRFPWLPAWCTFRVPLGLARTRPQKRGNRVDAVRPFFFEPPQKARFGWIRERSERARIRPQLALWSLRHTQPNSSNFSLLTIRMQT